MPDSEQNEMTQCDLNTIIQLHEKWLYGEPEGKKADLSNTNLSNTNLSNTNLHGANLHGADLHGADLHGAILSGANLNDADLHGAILNDANLRSADLHGANLHGANLNDADLHGAILSGANLNDAILRGADVDFSSWPLWCGSLKGVKVDSRIARQLAYHLCSVVCDDPEFISARNQILPFANKFHRVGECGKLKKVG